MDANQENRMNEPRVEQWMRDAAEAIVPESHVYFGASHEAERSTRLDAQERAREVRRVSELIAQHAPPDCERELRELADETGGMTVTVYPAVESWRISNKGKYATQLAMLGKLVLADSIPAAIRAAREAMGR